mgnify:CR=1 FL=1
MRIAEARVERRLLRYHSPITTAHGTIGDRWMVLLTLVPEAGNIGLGSAAPLVPFTSFTVAIPDSALRPRSSCPPHVRHLPAPVSL